MAEAVTLALGAKLGRLQAHKLVEDACRHAVQSGQHLKQVLAADPAIASELSAEQLDRLFDPSNYLGQAASFVDRVLHTHESRKSGSQ